MKKGLFVIIIASLLLLACENRTPKARRAVMDYETGVVQRKPDKVVHGKAKGTGDNDICGASILPQRTICRTTA